MSQIPSPPGPIIYEALVRFKAVTFKPPDSPMGHIPAVITLDISGSAPQLAHLVRYLGSPVNLTLWATEIPLPGLGPPTTEEPPEEEQ